MSDIYLLKYIRKISESVTLSMNTVLTFFKLTNIEKTVAHVGCSYFGLRNSQT